MPHTRISRETREKARDHRKYLSKAERILWSHLRELKSEGMRFRRQAPLGPYIVDFAWLGGRTVVELDGDNHEGGQQKQHDAVRDAFLRQRGFRILRFSNWDAIDVPEWVVGRIREAAESSVRQPHPTAASPRPPSPQGGGEPRGVSRSALDHERPR
ncbi:MAG TPA: endonuclease domain-containing protein [Propylenella sp.]